MVLSVSTLIRLTGLSRAGLKNVKNQGPLSGSANYMLTMAVHE